VLELASGYYEATLGSIAALPSDAFDGSSLYLTVRAGSNDGGCQALGRSGQLYPGADWGLLGEIYRSKTAIFS
jgi:hypothetical protein